MSTISASTTSTTAYKVTADTTGALVLQTGATPTTAVTIDTSQNVLIGGASAQTGAVLAVTGGIQGTVKSGTAVASTSGTSIDFTSIPSWVKRITVVFNEVSTNGTSHRLIQIGSGSVTTTGYVSTGNALANATSNLATSSTAGFIIWDDSAAFVLSGHMVLTLVSANTWISSHIGKVSTTQLSVGGGSIALGGTLDRVRITTVNGTDTFDAGSINILYEG